MIISSKPSIFLICLVASALSVLALMVSPSPAISTGVGTAAFQLDLIEFASDLKLPLGLAKAGPDDNRLFLYEKGGRIKIIQPDGQVAKTLFLNITDRVNASSEQGLRGLAFHPNYANNGYFYVNYTHTSGNVTVNRISRFQVSSNPNRANAGSETVLLTVIQPTTIHSAGEIHFGMDGYLYILLGDGGSPRDEPNRGQTTNHLLGKIARIDVNAQNGSPADCKGLGSGNYTVPATNPFVDGAGKNCDEIWSLGLRAPWRFSFDRLTGDLFLGDVGQDAWEEVNFQRRNAAGGQNYGWRCYEGNHPYRTDGCRPRSDYKFPIFEYSSRTGTPNCAIITGYMYRGTQYPAMYGHFFMTDFCSGIIWDLTCTINGWQVAQHTNLQEAGRVGFGEDAQGELYVISLYENKIYRLVQNTPVAAEVREITPSEGDTILYLPIIRKSPYVCV